MAPAKLSYFKDVSEVTTQIDQVGGFRLEPKSTRSSKSTRVDTETPKISTNHEHRNTKEYVGRFSDITL